MFKQTLGEFISSKTNWIAITAIGSSIVGFYSGLMNPLEAYQTFMGGLMGLTIRDTLHNV